MSAVRLDPVHTAVDAIRRGQAVVVVDDESRENEGDIIFAAQHATEVLLALTIRHSSGVICVPMPAERLAQLELPPMTATNADPLRTAFAVSTDARAGVTTGISAADRARTITVLADPATQAHDLVRPGHIFPLAARPGGVRERPGHTEAAVDLTLLAGLDPIGVLAELVNDDGTMMRAPQLREFADQHQMPMISIADLVHHQNDHRRDRAAAEVNRVATTTLPTRHGDFLAHGYRSPASGTEHLALVLGDVGSAEGTDILVRVHSECLTGDVLGSQRCDCGTQLDNALHEIAHHGTGVLIYLRGQEGRGIGLVEKLRAYELQEAGRDTVDANLDLGHPVDTRTYTAAATILRDLQITSIRLITNNPDKVTALDTAGIHITARVPARTSPTEHNARYLATKRDRLGHHL